MGTGKQYKSVSVDYALLETYDDTEKCIVCLTPRQAVALAGFMRLMYWETRWQNLPVGFDLFNWVSDIEGELIMCGCGNSAGVSELSQCICDLTALIRILVNNDTVGTIPEIPPDDPSQNLPGLNPSPGIDQQRLDSALCDLSKLAVQMIFDTIYNGQVADCNGQDTIDWLATAQTSLAVFSLGAAAFPPAAPLLFASGVAAAGVAFAAEFLDFQPFADEDCPPERLPPDWVTIYGCQLWQSFEGGITFGDTRKAFDCINPVAVQWYRDNIVDSEAIALIKDAETRSLLSRFVQQAQFYQFLMASANELSSSPYQGTALCDDCTEATGPNIDITAWTDARILSVIPPPDIEHSPSDWQWNASSRVTVRLDKLYVLKSFNAQIKRGITIGQPNEICISAGDDYCDGSGGTGAGNINITIDQPVYSFVISPNSTSNPMRLDIGAFDKKIVVQETRSYNQC